MDKEIDLLHILKEIKRKIIVVIVMMFLGSVITGVYSFFVATPIYQSTANLLLNASEETENSGQALNDITMYQKLMTTYVEIAQSDVMKNEVAKDLGYNSYSEIAKVITNISVKNTPNSQLLDIAIQGTDRDIIQEYAEVYVKNFKDITASKFKKDNLQVISDAKLQDRPVAPHKMRNIALGAIGGMVVSLLIIVMRFLLNDSIRTKDELVDLLGLPVIGNIPKGKEVKF